MAYNRGWNPDALPAHAEPDQAAQILSEKQQEQQQPPQQSSQPPPPQRPGPDQRKYSGPSRPSPRPHTNTSPNPYNDPRSQLPSAQYQNNYANTSPNPYNDPRSQLPSAQYQNNYNKPQPPIPPAGSPHSYSYSPPARGYQPPIPPPGPGVGQADRPSPPSRPPPTPAPPPRGAGGGDASLFPLFKAVDKNGTGHLTERELGKALVNGDFTQFDTHTVKMMIRMFDVDKNGSINFDEFSALWGFLAAWRGLFDRFDEDKSGYISFDEYTNALVSFGYRLSSNFVHMLYTTYDKGGEGKMSFDLFVQSCIILKRMTDVFKKYDEDRDGYITLSFEEFLTEILRQR